MSTYPRLESRVSVLERRQITLEARVEELSEDTTARFNQVDTRVEGLSKDMTASFRQLVEYHIQTENQINTHFNQVDARFDKIENRLDRVENDVADIKANMATKEDLSTLENRILDAFKQLIVQVTQQRPPSE